MADRQKQFNFQVWLMMGLLAGVIVAGFLLFPKSAEERDALLGKLGTTNHGSFIQPLLDVTQLPLETEAGGPWQYSEQKVKWRMLIPDDGFCQQDCRQLLHITRQLHIRLGKNTRRFERVYLLLGNQLSPDVEQLFATDHPYLKQLKTSADIFADWIGKANTGWQPGVARALLVDQQGQAMMYYTVDDEGNEMLEDVNHLLKYSPAP